MALDRDGRIEHSDLAAIPGVRWNALHVGEQVSLVLDLPRGIVATHESRNQRSPVRARVEPSPGGDVRLERDKCPWGALEALEDRVDVPEGVVHPPQSRIEPARPIVAVVHPHADAESRFPGDHVVTEAQFQAFPPAPGLALPPKPALAGDLVVKFVVVGAEQVCARVQGLIYA